MSIKLPLLSHQIDSGPFSSGSPYVNVSYANISNDMAKDISSRITSSCVSLSITHCTFEKDSFNRIFTKISYNNITTLDLSFNNLCYEEIKSLSDNLYKFSHLKDLNVSNNNLTSQDLSGLNCIFSSCTSLEKLDLSNNSIRFSSSERVFFPLQFVSSFKYLDLKNNSIIDSDIPSIARFIDCTYHNNTILNIKYNSDINCIGYLNLIISLKKKRKNVTDFSFHDLPLISKLNFIFSRNRPKIYSEKYMCG